MQLSCCCTHPSPDLPITSNLLELCIDIPADVPRADRSTVPLGVEFWLEGQGCLLGCHSSFCFSLQALRGMGSWPL